MAIRHLGSGVPDSIRHNQDHIDHVVHAKPGIKVFPDKLHVITPISNSQRFRTRYELYRQFEKHVEESGAILHTIEMAFGHRPFEVTEAHNSNHIQVRGKHEIWYKENLINIAIQSLPLEVKYIAWVDADVKFLRDDWAQETIQQLQHTPVVQMWSQIQDVSPDFELLNVNYPRSWAYGWVNGLTSIPLTNQKTAYPIRTERGWYGPPGLAWAATREALDHLGGLIDWGIVGSSDAYMASALVGGVHYQLRKDYHPEFANQFMIWQARAERYIRRNIGYVPGTAIHYWHGPKANRKYIDRNFIMVKHQFNPLTDLKKDSQGLWQLVDHGDVRSMELRDDLRTYFRNRDEDSTYISKE